MRAAFLICKAKAKQRRSRQWPNGIPWTLTFTAFKLFAERTNYVNATGNGAQCLTIDRINDTKGYVPGNIQPLSRAKNAEKQAKEQEKRFFAGFAWQRR